MNCKSEGCNSNGYMIAIILYILLAINIGGYLI